MTYALELRNIVKRFPGVLANDHISLQVEEGEIRALVGENGAGKTTLMRILYGLYQPDEGDILLYEQPQTFRNPTDAIQAGLGMVHQHFMLFPSLTVTENVIYGAEPAKNGLIDRESAAARVRQIADQYGLQVDPNAKVGALPVGVRQRIEILKMLYRDARILILDEPTAVLTPQERDGLFLILRRLREQGNTIIFITHKLHEVMSVSDNATVLRQGRVTGTLKTSETSPEEISRLMVGRDVLLRLDKETVEQGAVALSLNQLRVEDEVGRVLVHDATFDVYRGEIVGVAGVAGNGQTELIEAVMGLRPLSGGTLMLNGTDIERYSVRERRDAGLSYIPEDRSEVGLAEPANVSENLMMGHERLSQLSKNGVLNLRWIWGYARNLIKRFTIKVSSPREPASNLSGGNLQKLVVARELSYDASVLVAEQPTRGVDVGSIEFIHRQLIDYRERGRAVLLVSAELGEVISLADRILVMFEGRIVGEVAGDEATEKELGLLMAGGKRRQFVAQDILTQSEVAHG